MIDDWLLAPGTPRPGDRVVDDTHRRMQRALKRLLFKIAHMNHDVSEGCIRSPHTVGACVRVCVCFNVIMGSVYPGQAAVGGNTGPSGLVADWPVERICPLCS